MPLPPFALLLDRHGGELLAHARRLAPDAAEDVLQDGLLKALRAYPKLRHGDHLRAWLHRVVTSAAADHHRRRGRRVELPAAEPPEVAHHDVRPSDDGFAALVAGLPDGARVVLELRFVEDLDHAALAARLGCSEAAARQRLAQALTKLRAQMEVPA